MSSYFCDDIDNNFLTPKDTPISPCDSFSKAIENEKPYLYYIDEHEKESTMNYETSDFKPFEPVITKLCKDSIKAGKNLDRSIREAQEIIEEMGTKSEERV